MIAEFLSKFGSSEFMPHGHCFFWKPSILWSYVISDALIAVSYYSIPFGIYYFIRKRKDLEYKWVGFLFVLFISACGTTHLISIWTLWNPDYYLESASKIITAFFSIMTAILLWPLIPKLLNLPGHKDLERMNHLLQTEIEERRRVEKALLKSKEKLEKSASIKSKSLEEREKRLHAILENTVDGIITIDSKARIRTYNKACEKMFGYSSDEVIGRNIKMLMPSPYREQHDLYLGNYLRTGERKIIGIGREVKVQRRDGTTFDADLSVSEVELEEGRFFSGIIRDISERKVFEENLEMAKEEAIKANQAKSLFLANMSHEIRTPLNAILGMSEVVEETRLDDEQKRYLKILRRAGENLSQLINDILDLSKIEAKQLQIKEGNFNLFEEVESIIEMLSNDAIERGVHLNYYIENDINPYSIGDATRIHQILVNLIGNAIKFTHEGEVFVSVYRDKFKKGYIRFDVKDTGIGISEENLKAIFDRFQQVHNSATRNYGGTGLGLSICKLLVELMGGEIFVESHVGKGSVFSFSIPLKKQQRVYTKQEIKKPFKVAICEGHSTTKAILKRYTRSFNGEALLFKDLNDFEQKILPHENELLAILVDFRAGKNKQLNLIKEIVKKLSRPNLLVITCNALDLANKKEELKDIAVKHLLQNPVKRRDYFHLLDDISKGQENKNSIQIKTPAQPRILIVDDNEDVLFLVAEDAHNIGCEVVTSTSAEKALEICEQKEFDLIVSDIKMPSMSGIDFFSQIRQKGKKTPFIFITGKMFELNSSEFRAIAGEYFIEKPFNEGDIEKAIRKIVYKKDNIELKKVFEDQKVLRVLVADDSEDNRELVKAFTKKQDYFMDFVENGEEAYRKFINSKYDVVLMDMQMPVLDGYKATKKIRDWEKRKGRERTPIVALTAYALKEEQLKSLNAGCDDHLTKPIKKEKIIETIEKFGLKREEKKSA